MPVATSIFQAFTCREFENGDRLLRADYSIDCTSPMHASFKIVAAVTVVVIVIGQPVILLCAVILAKRAIARGDTEGVLVVIFRVLAGVSLRTLVVHLSRSDRAVLSPRAGLQ